MNALVLQTPLSLWAFRREDWRNVFLQFSHLNVSRLFEGCLSIRFSVLFWTISSLEEVTFDPLFFSPCSNSFEISRLDFNFVSSISFLREPFDKRLQLELALCFFKSEVRFEMNPHKSHCRELQVPFCLCFSNRTAFENLSPQSSHLSVCSTLPAFFSIVYLTWIIGAGAP